MVCHWGTGSCSFLWQEPWADQRGSQLGVRGPVKGEDPPEDKVPVLKSETDEVLALAGLSHLLPGKQRASGVPSLESEYPRCLWPPPSSLPLPWPPGARNPKT